METYQKDERQYVSRRKSPRRRYKRPVGVLHRGQYEVSRAVEISEGGLMVARTAGMKADERVAVTFYVPEAGLITARAIVLYDLENDQGEVFCGIKFLDPDIEWQRSIRRYIASKTSYEVEVGVQENKQPKTYTFSKDESGKPVPSCA